MFNDQYGLTRAVLEGRKTMTRRIIPEKYGDVLKFYERGVLVVPLSCIPIGISIEDFAKQWTETPGKIHFVPIDGKEEPQVVNCMDSMLKAAKFDSRYKVGEVVAVAQRYKDAGYSKETIQEGRCVRRGDHDYEPWYEDNLGEYGVFYIDQLAGWTNKMFVYAEMMPHRIEITDLRVERLQSISEEDCLKEGIEEFAPCSECGYSIYSFDGSEEQFYTAKDAFAALIDNTSGKGTWAKNPYVFVYTFDLVK